MKINENNFSFTRRIPAYTVKINTTAFDFHQPSLKQKTQKEYLPVYWKKLGMDQKKVSASCQDRLSELTTGQIDRIIDMQKIRAFLYQKKHKAKQVYFQYDGNRPNTHANVYQANFLAKINSIAIKRNIRHEKSEGFDQYSGEEVKKEREKEKKITTIPYKYLKRYKVDSETYQRSVCQRTEEDQEKSIASIDDQLQQFQGKLKSKLDQVDSISIKKDRRNEEGKISPSRRWFHGMSYHFINKGQPQQTSKMEIARIKGYDIESDVSLQRNRTMGSMQTKKNKQVTLFTDRLPAPLQKYRTNRVVSIN